MILFRKPDLHIANIEPGEHGQLAQIHKQSFARGWNEAEIKSMLQVTGTNCWGVKIRGRGAEGLKGFLILRAIFEQAEIITIAIDPKFRNKGLGRALMDHALRFLRRDEVHQLFLEVNAKNTGAIKLYQALNFRQISTRKSYYSNSSMPAGHNHQNRIENDNSALVMQLDLT